jgi:hypothetical protein
LRTLCYSTLLSVVSCNKLLLCKKLYKELSFAIFSKSVRAVSVRQTHGKKWEYNEAVVWLFSWRYNPSWLYFHSPVAGFSLLFEVS